ncbi:hypothetical protein AB0N64_06990 [Microbacterium sp. NPDC089318]
MLRLADRAVLAPPLPLITRDEARMLGVPISGASHLIVRRGMYVPRRAYSSLKAWEQYALRVHGYVRSHPDAVLCLESAAVLHGLPQFGHPRDIHVFDPDARRSQRLRDVCIHTSADARDVIRIAGIQVTSLADTVADLARAVTPVRALAITDSALSPAQGGDVRLADLMARAEGQRNGRGRAQLQWVCARADGRVESPAESVSRAVIEWSGFEEPELQREFGYEGYRDRTDFHFPSNNTIGEADGWGKYELTEPEKAAAHLRDEKRREDRLRRNGHPFARWDLADAWRVDPLVSALRGTGLAPRHPPQPAMLATLARSPRDRPMARETRVPARDGPQRALSRAGKQVSWM